MPKDSQNLKVLSLFSGCGGMDLGFEGGFRVLQKSINSNIHPDWINGNPDKGWVDLPHTRFKTIFANDIVPAAKAAWIPYFTKHGNHNNQFHLHSIVDLVKSHQKGIKIFPEADVVTGGFPCQDFSVSGKRNGFNSHKAHHGNLLTDFDNPSEENRGKLYMWMKRIIEIVLPKVFIAENVKGLVSLADAKKIIENDFRTIGTSYLVVNAKVLYAPMFGVPQSRERVIFIGFRKDSLTKKAIKELSATNIKTEFDPYPKQTHGSHELPLSHNNSLLPYVTVGDYILDLLEPHESQDLSQQSFSKAKWYGSHCQGQTEVDLGSIGPTIRAEHHGNIEFRRLALEHGGKYTSEFKLGIGERRLTVRECARIQTFPDDFEFVRKPSKMGKEYKLSASEGYKLVGNAVPPLLAFHIAWRLQKLWSIVMKKEGQK
ncbi:DNA cytosine methyltransferase [Candidatus Latescibacterota bacterium]